MDDLIQKLKKARNIWIVGNGGSASTAEHFATDLIKKGYAGVALTNSSVITMIGNDYGFEFIFSQQLASVGDSDDLLITISCSGKSRNIQNALAVANAKQMMIYEFEKFSEDRDYGKLEDKHLAFAHEVASKL